MSASFNSSTFVLNYMIIITLSGLLELPYSFFNICSLKHEQQNSISHFTQVLRNKVLARESPLIKKKYFSTSVHLLRFWYHGLWPSLCKL